jgi:hypothetical protein
MERTAAQPAPAGKRRAGVLFAAHAATEKSQGGDGDSSYPDRHGKHEVVLSVHLPGETPYAVHVIKFDHKKGKVGSYMAALPALVSATDRNDVEVQWDELLSIRDARKQGKQLAAGYRDAMQERVAAIQQASQAAAQAGPAGTPGPELYKQSARAALAAVGNSPQRQMVIEQFRRLGVEISDDGVVED